MRQAGLGPNRYLPAVAVLSKVLPRGVAQHPAPLVQVDQLGAVGHRAVQVSPEHLEHPPRQPGRVDDGAVPAAVLGLVPLPEREKKNV